MINYKLDINNLDIDIDNINELSDINPNETININFDNYVNFSEWTNIELSKYKSFLLCLANDFKGKLDKIVLFSDIINSKKAEGTLPKTDANFCICCVCPFKHCNPEKENFEKITGQKDVPYWQFCEMRISENLAVSRAGIDGLSDITYKQLYQLAILTGGCSIKRNAILNFYNKLGENCNV